MVRLAGCWRRGEGSLCLRGGGDPRRRPAPPLAACPASRPCHCRLPLPAADLEPGSLYGKFTWKIDKFNEVSKRELRSNTFEVGGYKW